MILNRAISFPVVTCHTRAVPSELPLTTVFPSGEKHTDETSPPCSTRVTSFPVAASHPAARILRAFSKLREVDEKAAR